MDQGRGAGNLVVTTVSIGVFSLTTVYGCGLRSARPGSARLGWFVVTGEKQLLATSY